MNWPPRHSRERLVGPGFGSGLADFGHDVTCTRCSQEGSLMEGAAIIASAVRLRTASF